jgi:2-polyprenyl-6-hydroxyphenyl methylase/3-demethylubiquinone-9 3-methyltransferase
MNRQQSPPDPSLQEAPKLTQGTAYEKYDDAEVNGSHGYLVPAVLDVLEAAARDGASRRLLDLGCGNGSATAFLAEKDFAVVGVDPSEQGIAIAQSRHPDLTFVQASCYEDLSARFGRFPFVVSMEVIEHLYWPRLLLKSAYDLLEPGGRLVLTTPYHGYLKNLALALTGQMDRHFDVTTDDGHIKFFSEQTLRELVQEAGFRSAEFRFVGRIPAFAKSMLLIATR